MKYDLVFEGGGAKGFVLVGACEEFFRRGHSFDRLLGTSAGAITATLLAAGYSPDEMMSALGEQEDGRSVFGTFMAVPSPFSDDELSRGAVHALLEGIEFHFLPQRVENRLDAELLRALAGNDRGRHLMAFIERGGSRASRSRSTTTMRDRCSTWRCAARCSCTQRRIPIRARSY